MLGAVSETCLPVKVGLEVDGERDREGRGDGEPVLSESAPWSLAAFWEVAWLPDVGGDGSAEDALSCSRCLCPRRWPSFRLGRAASVEGHA